jgi:hypothetical protein
LLDVRAHDGARHFASLPQRVSARRLRAHLRTLEGVRVGDLLTNPFEDWLDFTFGSYSFRVHGELGRYGFTVEQPDAPADVLLRVAAHARALLGEGSS